MIKYDGLSYANIEIAAFYSTSEYFLGPYAPHPRCGPIVT